MRKYLFTSESVTEGHPDKICDQISDAVLDAILAKDPQARVACETTCTTGMVYIMGEISTSCYVDIPKIARQVIRDIGYTDPQPGDIVVLTKEFDAARGPIVKRIIAVEGQTVDIDFVSGAVYVDGELLEEDYINEPTYVEEGTEFPLTVPEGSIFVMGDNRNHSSDSRSSDLGTVDTRYVIGKAVFLLFPGADEATGQRDFGRIGPIAGID